MFYAVLLYATIFITVIINQLIGGIHENLPLFYNNS
jgi:hypothetical protein